ncbi:MAG: hypothetical protein JWR26_747 [Pedosphaera sp.]|nr:hypothetical protein [Pedosphaera sp.]
MGMDAEKEIKEMTSTLSRLEKEIDGGMKNLAKASKESGGAKFPSEDRLMKAQDGVGKMWKQLKGLSASTPPPEFKKAIKGVEGLEADVKDACQRLDREFAEAKKEQKTEAAATGKELAEMQNSMSRLDKRIIESKSEMDNAIKKAKPFPDLREDMDVGLIKKLEAKQTQVQKMVDGLSPAKSSSSDFKKVSAAVDDLSDEVDDVSRRVMRDIADLEKEMKQAKA